MKDERNFINDKLGRKSEILNVMKIINTIEKVKGNNSSISIAINDKWGNGKSSFMRLWMEYVETNFQDKIIYYNSWEYDDCDSALLPILYQIISISDNEDDEVFIKKAKLFLKSCGYSLTKVGIRKVFGEDSPVEKIVCEGIDDLKDADIKTIFDEYGHYYEKREVLAEKLTDLVSIKGKLWVFVDELDYCRPDFALKSLEAIKHYFNIPNIIFVFTVDLGELASTTNIAYGLGIDADSYLRKFFDYIYNLTSPNLNKYIDTKVMEHAELKKFDNYIITLFKKLEFTLCDIDETFNHFIYFYTYYKNIIDLSTEVESAMHIYFYFIAIKDKFYNDYINIIHGKFSIDKEKGQWKKLDEKLQINQSIKELLIRISKGKAERTTIDLFEKYHLFNISTERSFSKYMESILNYIAE